MVGNEPPHEPYEGRRPTILRIQSIHVKHAYCEQQKALGRETYQAGESCASELQYVYWNGAT
jgi:hypothetical protein